MMWSRLACLHIAALHNLLCFHILLTKATNEGEAEAGATQPGFPPPCIIGRVYERKMKEVSQAKAIDI